MRALIARLREERGFASVTALVTMIVMLSVAGAVFGSSIQLSNSSNKDDAGQRAYQAAVGGVNTAISRIDSLKPAANECITTVKVGMASGWCDAVPGVLGKNQNFTYRVSTSPPPGGTCAGDPLDANSGDRCVVGVGVVNGVERTVAARLGLTGTQVPFSSNTGLVGYKDITVKKGAQIKSNVGVNKNFKGKGATIPSPYALYLGPKGKAKGYTGVTNVKATDFFPAPVSFFNPPDSTLATDDTAIKNDNTRMSGILSPTTYVNDANGRFLTVGDGRTVTLPGSGQTDAVTGLPVPAYYNFCKLTLGKNSKVAVAPGAWVRIYIDSRDRQGSRCKDNGELKAGKDSSFTNPNNDPRSLQIFAWSKKTKLTIPNKQAFAGLIYAPNSKVKFSGKGKLTGGVAAQTVEIRKDMTVQSSSILNTYTVPGLQAAVVTAWRQCQSYVPGAAASPASGC